MARDTGSFTTSSLPVTDPLHTLTVSAASANNTTTLSYTTSGVHNLYVGAPVVIYGTGSANFNFNPSLANDSTLGWGTPAVVSAVTGTNTFQVKAPSVVATASVSQGTVVNDALVSNSGWDQSWLPTSAQTNVVVAREWGNGFPIQPNDDRVSNIAITGVSANGSQVTYTVNSGHGVVAGQKIQISGMSPAAYNVGEITVAATTSTTIVVNSTVTAAVVSYANGAITVHKPFGGLQGIVASAVGPYGATSPTTTTTSTTSSGATIGVNSVTGLNVGMGVSATNIASGSVITAVGTNSITISPAVTGSVASAATLTFSGTQTNQYVTNYPHNLSAGQPIVVTGASNPVYNVSGLVAAVVDSKTFTVAAPKFKITKVSGTSGSGAVGDGTNVLYYTDSAHSLAAGDKVSVYGMAPSGYNVTSGTVLSAGLASNAFAVANTTTTAVTATGYAVENHSTFTAPASVYAGGDASWSSAQSAPSGNLDPSADNHDRVTNADSGYPAFTPSYTAPNIIGLTTTNAIQKIRAAGMTPGFVQFTSDLSVTAVSTTASNVTYTTGTTNHNLQAGDTVNLSGGSVTTHNLGDVIVASVNGYTFTIAQAGVTGTVGTGLVARPKNTVVSAQSPSAGATTATVVGFTRNYGL